MIGYRLAQTGPHTVKIIFFSRNFFGNPATSTSAQTFVQVVEAPKRAFAVLAADLKIYGLMGLIGQSFDCN